jgi:hypothetical protein
MKALPFVRYMLSLLFSGLGEKADTKTQKKRQKLYLLEFPQIIYKAKSVLSSPFLENERKIAHNENGVQ